MKLNTKIEWVPVKDQRSARHAEVGYIGTVKLFRLSFLVGKGFTLKTYSPLLICDRTNYLTFEAAKLEAENIFKNFFKPFNTKR